MGKLSSSRRRWAWWREPAVRCLLSAHEPSSWSSRCSTIYPPGVSRIDMIEFSGIEFRHVDNRLMSLKLVQLGLSQAAMFSAKARCCSRARSCTRSRCWWSAEPSGRDQGQHQHVGLRAREFFQGLGRTEGTIVELAEITMRNLLTEEGEIDPRDFLARADVLAAAARRCSSRTTSSTTAWPPTCGAARRSHRHRLRRRQSAPAAR